MIHSKFKLAIVNLFNTKIHGIITDENINEEQLSRYFINEESIDIIEFYNTQTYEDIIEYITELNDIISEKIENGEFGEYYTSIFKNLIKNKIISLQVIQQIQIGDYHMAILKTHWIKLIQRKWREIRNSRLKAKMNIFNLKYREIHGKYPNSCNIPFRLGILN